MFERFLRRYVGRVPITPGRVTVFLIGVLVVSSLLLYSQTSSLRHLQISYLIYDNPGRLPETGDPTEIRQIETDALKTALALSSVLNRSLILPDLHCWTCKEPSTDPDSPECSKLSWRLCGIEDVFSWKEFSAAFAAQTKPVSFLSNHAIRERLMTSVSPLYVLDSELTRTRTKNILSSDAQLLSVPKLNGNDIPLDNVVELMKDAKPFALLRFHSLFFNIKSENQKFKAIQQKISNALVPISQT